MATKIPGETYRGNTLHVPLSADVMTPPPAIGMGVATIACKRHARPIAIFPSMSNAWRIRSSGP